MSTVTVRYIVDDVDTAIAFYVQQLWFEVDLHPAAGFARLVRGDLHLLLTDPGEPTRLGGAAQPMPDGRTPAPGGWNRFQLTVDDLPATVERLRAGGATFRNDIVHGMGGAQVLLEDPAGNPIELLQPADRR